MDDDTRKALEYINTALGHVNISAVLMPAFVDARAGLEDVLERCEREPEKGSSVQEVDSSRTLSNAIQRSGNTFVASYETMELIVYATAVAHGWWENKRDELTLLMLIVTELAEAAEACRMAEMPKSDHIPKFTLLEEELADVVIRVMDMSRDQNLRVAEAIVAKAAYNQGRPYRHGGKRH